MQSGPGEAAQDWGLGVESRRIEPGFLLARLCRLIFTESLCREFCDRNSGSVLSAFAGLRRDMPVHGFARLRRVAAAKRGATAPQAAGGKPPGGLRGGDRHRNGARTRWTREAL